MHASKTFVLCPLLPLRMIRRSTLRALSMISLLSWACLIGLMMNEETPAQAYDTILLAGSVKEVFQGPDSISISFSPFSSSQELFLSIPPGMPPPKAGITIVVSFHTMDSGLVIDNLYAI